MAQGTIKTKPKPKTSGLKSNTTKNGITKKGSLKFNPKKSSLIKQAKISKKFTSGLTAQTERMLGARAGHLEMLGSSKKKANEPKKHGARQKQKQQQQQQKTQKPKSK